MAQGILRQPRARRSVPNVPLTGARCPVRIHHLRLRPRLPTSRPNRRMWLSVLSQGSLKNPRFRRSADGAYAIYDAARYSAKASPALLCAIQDLRTTPAGRGRKLGVSHLCQRSSAHLPKAIRSRVWSLSVFGADSHHAAHDGRSKTGQSESLRGVAPRSRRDALRLPIQGGGNARWSRLAAARQGAMAVASMILARLHR